ncbi:MAG: Rrf2 family transcriptional regulator, partial [Candidatus Omnitrophota bacterium]
ISQEEQLPIDYIEQLLLKLRRSNIVKSIRGRSGGYILSNPTGKITIKDIIEAVEGNIFETICFGPNHRKNKCIKLKDCVIKSVWLGLKDKIEDYLEKITIKDLLKGKF